VIPQCLPGHRQAPMVTWMTIGPGSTLDEIGGGLMHSRDSNISLDIKESIFDY
jgi:hypothetical protein